MSPPRSLWQAQSLRQARSLWKAIREATTPADRWLALLSGLGIIALGFGMPGEAGGRVIVFKENSPVATYPLDTSSLTHVEGRLGRVTIEVQPGKARLVESNSPRLIGTRTGWISRGGEIAVCIPCGVMIRIEGKAPPSAPWDAMAH